MKNRRFFQLMMVVFLLSFIVSCKEENIEFIGSGHPAWAPIMYQDGNSIVGVGHSFWVSLSPIVTTSPTIPAGVYSTVDLGAIGANATFSAPLSSATGMPAVTPGTLYYFVAWSNVGGTWYPGAVLNFTTL